MSALSESLLQHQTEIQNQLNRDAHDLPPRLRHTQRGGKSDRFSYTNQLRVFKVEGVKRLNLG